MSDASNERMLRIRRTLAKTPVGKTQFLLMLADVSFGSPDGGGKGSFDKDSRSIIIDPDLSDAEAVQELGYQVMDAFVETSRDQNPQFKQLEQMLPVGDLLKQVGEKLNRDSMNQLKSENVPGFDTLVDSRPAAADNPMLGPAIGMVSQVLSQAMEQGFQMGMQDEGFRLEVESVLGDDWDNDNTPPTSGGDAPKDEDIDIPDFKF
ncbi:MAG: hypothetical protein Alpg2KO_27400 [Alphaproteobacteria bacterium]